MIKRGVILVLAFTFLIGINFISVFTGDASEGSTVSNVSISGLRIIYNNFNGSTTGFNAMSTPDLENLTNMTLEISAYGKVIFNELVNLTLVAGSDRTVNFDNDLTIASNAIAIDNSALPYLNKSVNITLTGLSFSNPQIMKNGIVCADCTKLSYSGGVIVFKTNVFYGAYFIRETPVSEVCGNGVCGAGETSSNCAADCGSPGGPGGGGGGGGGGQISNQTGGIYSFYVQPTFFVAQLKKGSYYQRQIKIVNNGTKDLTIGIAVVNLSEFIFPEVQSVSLKKGESTNLTLHIYISDTRPSDVYVGKVLFRTSQLSKDTRVILDVKDKNALFDIRTKILKRYVRPGGIAMANVSIINMGDLRNFDVSLEYKAIDFDNNEYVLKKEDFAINETFNGIFELELPEDIPLGDYVFYTKIYAGNVTASSYDTFTVEKVSFLAWLLLILVILIIMIVVFIRIARDKGWGILGKRNKDKKDEVKEE